eukprot:TRINITY_DN3014_c0_g1_i1.p2 TRINITY_DN3014_c0_g1~~TRINITY_DN3014_c0_g1_i1.p2  ORF type:complete len:105 (-),score=15.04 TRINITY_DN3014_c0_g1_i1:125-439(-)
MWEVAPGDFATGKRSHLRNTDQSRLERWGESQGAANLRPEQSSTCLINSTELTVTNLELDLVTAKGPVPRTSCSTSPVKQARTEPEVSLPAATEQHILQLCHAG